MNYSTGSSQSFDFSSPEYLAELINDRKQLSTFPNIFIHLERLLNLEINRVRNNLFNILSRPKLNLPTPDGEKKVYEEKIFVPVKLYPDFNFMGRLLGPRGLSAKQFEVDTGCKLIIRGRGSYRDKQKEVEYRDKSGYEHLNEDLHVILQCDDYENRAHMKLEYARNELNKLLIPPNDGEDSLKKQQLTELAILRGTYRDPYMTLDNSNQFTVNTPLFISSEIPMITQTSFLSNLIPIYTPPIDTSVISTVDSRYHPYKLSTSRPKRS